MSSDEPQFPTVSPSSLPREPDAVLTPPVETVIAVGVSGSETAVSASATHVTEPPSTSRGLGYVAPQVSCGDSTSEDEGAYVIRDRQTRKEDSDVVLSSDFELCSYPLQPPPGKVVSAITLSIIGLENTPIVWPID